MTSTEVLTEAAGCILDATQAVLKRYRRWVKRDDVVQEMWLWVYERMAATTALLADDRKATLTYRLRRVGEAYARREKAAQSGYSADDEVFYSLRAIRELLPEALDPDATPSQQQQEVSVRTSRDGYGGWEATMADLRAALAKATPDDRALLDARYREGVTPDALAAGEGVTTDVIYGRLGRAVRRLQRHLGGASPQLSPS